MTERIYLDWNASAPLRPEARAAALAALEATGNPSSVHVEGRAARRLIEQARDQVAALVGADPRNVVFTSGGTEANMLALVPAIDGTARDKLLVSAIEHPSVLAGGRFPAAAVERLAVTAGGEIDLAALERRMAAREGRALVSLMLANNETGVVQPISQAASVVHAGGGLLHVDAVQAVGRISCDIKVLGADLLTLSGHKIGAPKGVGALIARTALSRLDPLIKGGGQERNMRAGTENVAAIAGFGAAAAAARDGLATERARMAALRERLEADLKAASPEVVIFGAAAAAAPKPAMAATFSVPARMLRSCPPPLISGSRRLSAAGRPMSAPTPLGAPILCPDRVRRSAPSALISQGIRPAAWTASTCSTPPAAWITRAA